MYTKQDIVCIFIITVKNKWKLVYKYPNNTIIYTYYAGIGNFVGKNLVGGCGDNQFNSNTFLFTLK